jgi:hypothetical protein
MKKKYLNPMIVVVRLRATNHILSGSGRAVDSLRNSEGFGFDSDGLDSGDDLR